jgi:hypothetical protein
VSWSPDFIGSRAFTRSDAYIQLDDIRIGEVLRVGKKVRDKRPLPAVTKGRCRSLKGGCEHDNLKPAHPASPLLVSRGHLKVQPKSILLSYTILSNQGHLANQIPKVTFFCQHRTCSSAVPPSPRCVTSSPRAGRGPRPGPLRTSRRGSPRRASGGGRP